MKITKNTKNLINEVSLYLMKKDTELNLLNECLSKTKNKNELKILMKKIIENNRDVLNFTKKEKFENIDFKIFDLDIENIKFTIEQIENKLKDQEWN